MVSPQCSNHPMKCGLLLRQGGFQTVHRIHVQVEAIRDMKRMGRALSNRISKSKTPVMCHDLHTGMLAKPSGHRFHFTVS
jgi:hypothetical protein